MKKALYIKSNPKVYRVFNEGDLALGDYTVP